MKCPDDDCHFETTDKVKYCPECGSKLVSSIDKALVVLCSGRNEDGSVCNTELNQTLKFCSNCGTKVDPNLFSSHEERCHGCSLRLKAVDTFCSECGLKKGQYPKTTPLEHEKDRGIVQHKPDGMEHIAEVEPGTETTAPLDETPKSTSNDDRLPQEDHQPTFATPTSEANGEIGADTESEEPDVEGNKNVQPKENESPKEEYMDASSTAGIVQDEESSSETRTTLENEGGIQTAAIHAQGSSSQFDESSLPDGVEDLKIEEDSDSKPNNDEKHEEIDVEIYDDKASSMSTLKRKSKLKPADQTKKMKREDSSDQRTSSEEDPETKSKHQHESTGQQDTDSLHSANKTALSSTTECQHMDKLQEGDSNEDKQQSVFGEAKTWTNPETSNLPENSSKATPNLFEVDVQKQNKEIEAIPETSSNQSTEEMHTKEDADARQSDNPSDSDDSDSEQEDKQDGNQSEGTTNQDEAGDNGKKEGRRQKKNRKRKEGRADKKKKKIEKQKQKNPKSAEKSNKRDESVGNTTKDSGSSGSSTINKGSSSANIGKSPQFYKVVFHVLVSPEFKFNPTDQEIVIKIGDQAIGKEWKEDFVFEFKRLLPDETAELVHEMKVPYDKVQNGKELSYKYCVRKKKKDSYTWENYVKSGASGVSANRTLKVPYEWKDEEIWHQYDGFIEKAPKGLISVMADWVTWKKKLIARAKLAVEVFLEQLIQMDMQCQMTTFEVQLEMVMNGLLRTYYVDGRCWNILDNCRKDIAAIVISTIYSNLQQKEMDTTEKERLLEKERRLYYATGVILVFKKHIPSKILQQDDNYVN